MGAITVFRSFRLFRIFKLARSWTSLKRLLKVLVTALSDIKNFSVLVLLFMIISALLGMEMFAYRADLGNSEYPRMNFNNFYDSMLTVFALLTNEDWNNIMYSHMISVSSYSLFYFVAVVVIGNYILLKLFLAILINTF